MAYPDELICEICNMKKLTTKLRQDIAITCCDECYQLKLATTPLEELQEKLNNEIEYVTASMCEAVHKLSIDAIILADRCTELLQDMKEHHEALSDIKRQLAKEISLWIT